MRYQLRPVIILLAALLISGCGEAKSLVTEISSETISYDETIRIKNCGNKADSVQTASRSFSTELTGAGTFKAGYEVVEGSVSTTYGQYKNVTKSQTLTAAPDTNMEFVLRWSEDVRAGNVTLDGESAEYTVHIPVSVEQISSRDLGCGADVSSLAGKWSGTIKSPDGSFSTELNLSFEPNCKMNEVCGAYDAYQLPCAGTLTLVGVDGDSFIFLETKTSGEDWCGFCYEHIQRLAGNSISYGCSGTGQSIDINSTGILSSP